MVVVAIVIISICAISAALFSVASCMLSSKISQEEERNKKKED